jgi:hypothetical protein
LVGDAFKRLVGVLEGVMNHGSCEGCFIEPISGENVCHGDGMDDVWVARRSLLALVRRSSDSVRGVDDFGRRTRVGVDERLSQLVHHLVRRPPAHGRIHEWSWF